MGQEQLLQHQTQVPQVNSECNLPHLNALQFLHIFIMYIGGSYYYHWMRDAGLSIKAWMDINDNDYDRVKDVLSAFVKWVNVVQHKSDPNNIDVRIGK